MNVFTTEDIKNELVRKYKNNDFRILYNGEVKTVEIQNAHFICDKDWIVRKPNYEYAQKEIEWYKSQSLFVDDIPGKTPVIWEQCADKEGKINSNYGWCIWSNENGNQYRCCLHTLLKDIHSRQAVMLYTRPSMQKDANENGRHDFMCTYAVQCFLNEVTNEQGDDGLELKYIVFMRSNDAVFGFDNDVIWHKYVAEKLAKDIETKLDNDSYKFVTVAPIEWNAASLHVYERHFKYLEE